MPIYNYRCKVCNREFETYESMDKNHSRKCCGKTADRVFSSPCLITDTSFPMTGVRDPRLDNEVIEGRDHWNRKLKEKGYMELTQSEFKNAE